MALSVRASWWNAQTTIRASALIRRSPDRGETLNEWIKFSNSRATSAGQVRDQRDYKEHEENKEQNLGDSRGRDGDTTKSEYRSNNGHYQKD